MSPAPAIDIPAPGMPWADGFPMDPEWHRHQVLLLIELTHQRFWGRNDISAGGDMVIYYSFEQAREVMNGSETAYRGPDWFAVLGVDGTRERQAWVAWEEGGRYPNIVIELLSPRTGHEDLQARKAICAEVFRAPEYYCYDGDGQRLRGWRLTSGRYAPMAADENGRMWSAELEVWLSPWKGVLQTHSGVWLRFFDRSGGPIPTKEEAVRNPAFAVAPCAETERERAVAAAERAVAAELDAEIARERSRHAVEILAIALAQGRDTAASALLQWPPKYARELLEVLAEDHPDLARRLGHKASVRAQEVR
ncbi:MAG: Uma2 family endonuclease [Candidatus Schekmanbacteria bacterium]|nr:Uma2 family endonuclease [Candidatus Schekmanbacteria bacterium]